MKSTTYLLMLFCVFLSPTMSIGQNCTGNDVPPAPYVGDLQAFCGCQSATAKAQHRDAFYQALPNKIFEWYDNPNHLGTPLNSRMDGNVSLFNSDRSQTVYVFETNNGCYSPPSQVELTAFSLPTTLPRIFQGNAELPNFTTLRSCEAVVLTATPSKPNGILSWYETSSRSQLLATGPTYTITSGQSVFVFEEPEAQNCTGTGDVLMCYGAPTQINIIILPKPTVNVGADQVLCKAGDTKTLTATVSDGSPPFEYLWSNGETTPSITVSTPLNYGVTVTNADFFRCSATDNINVSLSTLVVLLGADKTVCPNATTTITSSVSGGKAPFIYAWNNGQSTPSVTVGAGTYQVTVTDDNGCLSSDEVVVKGGNGLTVNIQQVNNRCNGANDGGIFITPLSGTQPFSYSIDNGTSWSQNANFYRLIAGTYITKVKDNIGCVFSKTITITQGTAINFSAKVTKTSCIGSDDGKITFNQPTGGSGSGNSNNYKYSINYGNNLRGNGNFKNLDAGIYYLRVQDGIGCFSDIQPIEVSKPAPITFVTTIQNITCGYTSNGIIGVAAVSGGAPQYKYSKNGGDKYQSNNSFLFLTAGTYPMRVRDNKGCESPIQNIVIKQNCGTQYSVRQAKPVQKIPVVIYSIAPNPSDDFIRIELNSLNVHEQEFLFFDALGKAILTQKRLLEAGVQRVEFDVSGLPQGVYQIITNGSYARNEPNRFVKI